MLDYFLSLILSLDLIVSVRDVFMPEQPWKEVNFILKNFGTRTLRVFCLDKESFF